MQNSKEGEDARWWVRERGEWGGSVKNVSRPWGEEFWTEETRRSVKLLSGLPSSVVEANYVRKFVSLPERDSS